jgi:hypothetical protein
MAVRVEGDGDRAVSEALADNLRVYAASEQKRCARVPQAIEREVRGQASGNQSGLEVSFEQVAPQDRSACGCSKHQW